MHRLFAICLAIYLAGDPSLSMLSMFNESRDVVVAFALAWLAVPWVASQIDN